MDQQTTLTAEEMAAFCRACSWAHEAWSLHRAFQARLPASGELAHRHGYFFNRLSHITQEYVLLEVCKLHDPAVQGRNVNLTLEFIVMNGDWDDATRTKLEELKSQLEAMSSHLTLLRRKRLAHTDRDSAIVGQVLGGFPDGLDESYFSALQEFVDIAHDASAGGPYPFDTFAHTDVELLVGDLALAMEAHNQRLQPTARR
jgi:AbiU2